MCQKMRGIRTQRVREAPLQGSILIYPIRSIL